MAEKKLPEDDNERQTEAGYTQRSPHKGFWSLCPVQWCITQYRELVAAVRFLSILPMPGSARLFRTDETEPALVIGSVYFPLVGLLIAAIATILPFVIRAYLSPLILAALLVVLLIWLTGGLHLDGLMDTCDGVFGGTRRERKLEIMRDSRVGSFGVLGGGSILLLKFAVLASLNWHQIVIALLLILPVARWSMVLAIFLFPSARPSGLGSAVRQTVTLPRVLLAAAWSLGIVLVIGQLVGVITWLLASLVATSIGLWITRQLGGLTGDVYGAIAEVTEVVCWLGLALFRF